MSKTLTIQNKTNGHTQTMSEDGWQNFKYKHLYKIIPSATEQPKEVKEVNQNTKELIDAVSKATTPEEVDAIGVGVTTAAVVKAKAEKKASLKKEG